MEVTSILIRRVVTLLVAASIICGGGASAAHAFDRSHLCKYPFTVQGNRRTVSCFAKKFGVDPAKARYIANRESHFYRYAWNHSSDCRGLFQHKYAYWASRTHTYAAKLRHWHVKHWDWYNPRAQAVVTMAMVTHGGWGPWGG